MHDVSETIANAMNTLNDKQREAVETLEGAVLVVAGPGTGKTQLLSLRVANILATRDVRPENILCLTYTEAGAIAMTQRLASFVGSMAYEVQVATFHGFAQSLRSKYTKYFPNSAFERTISPLVAARKINKLLQQLRLKDALYQAPFGTINGNLSSVHGLFGGLKKCGMTSSQIREICQQNLELFDFIHEQTNICELVSSSLSGNREFKEQLLEEMRTNALQELAKCSKKFGKRISGLTNLTTAYKPYIQVLEEAFDSFCRLDDDDAASRTGKTTEFSKKLRERFFEKDAYNNRRLKDYWVTKKLLNALDVYDRYLEWMNASAYYDFDDMILDAINAIQKHPELQHELAERYQYIMIDEFQDTNGSQMLLVEQILSAKPEEKINLLVVGDDDQAIMRFQGASVELLNGFEKQYQAKRIVLLTNYRSTSPLVELGKSVAAYIESRLPSSATDKCLQAFRESTPDTQTNFKAQAYSDKSTQYWNVARLIRERINNGFMNNSKNKGTEIAVIAAKHQSLLDLIPYLEHFHIAFNYKIQAEVNKMDTLQTLLALMRFAAALSLGDKVRAEVELPQIFASCELGIAKTEYLNFAIEAKEARSWLNSMNKTQRSSIRKCAEWLRNMAAIAPSTPVREMLFTLSAPLREYYEKQVSEGSYRLIEFNYGLRRLFSFVEDELADAKTAAKLTGNSSDYNFQNPRLSDIVRLLDDASSFNQDLNVQIPVSKENAITLTTAHSSKGLEYDLVYILDADDKTWHSNRTDTRLSPYNIFLSNEPEDDDRRRLLFVAITRARNELELHLATPGLVRELIDLDLENADLSPLDVTDVSRNCWQANYMPDAANIVYYCRKLMSERPLSASLLNSIVEFNPNDITGTSIFNKRLLKLPEAPNYSVEFGNLMHKFFQDYINIYHNKTDANGRRDFQVLETLIEKTKRELAHLDYNSEIINQLQQRYYYIVNEFVGKLPKILTGDVISELKICNISFEDIPLMGYIDVLLKDNENKTLRILDFKTGRFKEDRVKGSNYERQIEFYKLALSCMPEFYDWQISGGADIFIEPLRERGIMTMPPLAEFDLAHRDIEHLKALVKAAWQRLQNGKLDSQGFIESEEYLCIAKAALRENGAYKPGGKAMIQAVYEDWLIATS
ncbi:MAG: ATP-dependent helicase [Coriobacteriales bacterium]|nr:ATP-dependent helicase [Coriobacteriales bacterium]